MTTTPPTPGGSRGPTRPALGLGRDDRRAGRARRADAARVPLTPNQDVDSGRSVAVAEQHFDQDHRLYELILGPWNQHSCCFLDGTKGIGIPYV